MYIRNGLNGTFPRATKVRETQALGSLSYILTDTAVGNPSRKTLHPEKKRRWMMRALCIALCLLFLIVPSLSADTPAGENSQIDQEITRIENSLVIFTSPMAMLQPGNFETDQLKTLSERMAHYKVPGVGIAVINHQKISWAAAYGVTKAGGDVTVTEETLFEAASTSKLVVAAIALRFVERGLLNLDDDVNQKLTSWKIPENSFTEPRQVTLRMLLTHQAGLNRPEGGFSWEEGRVPTLVQTLNGEAPAQNEAAVIEYNPGSKWQYSNFGYLVIQQILEDVANESFPEIARKNVFEPLGMTSSTFEPPGPGDAELRKNEAMPHDAQGIAHKPELHPTAVANGGLLTTPSDLALFTIELILAYQGISERILSQEMVRKMFHRELELDPSIFGLPIAEGLGVLLYGEGQELSFLHPGDNQPGASSWLMGYPNSGNGIIIMTNGAMGNLLAMEIVAAAVNEYGWSTERSDKD
jgi:CubicO group peptidase (beta-lactamase class C family)